MDFINQISIACATMLIGDVMKYTDELYDMTCVKCTNLMIPSHTDYNKEIIERELEFTQDYIFDFILSTTYAIEKDIIKELKSYVRKQKNNCRKQLYQLNGMEMIKKDEN